MEMTKMNKDKFYNNLFDRFIELVTDNNLLDKRVTVTGRALSAI